MSHSPSLVDLDVSEFARRLASGDPTPGGGSAAALSGALAAALLSMVARLTAAGRSDNAAGEELRSILLGASTALSDLLSLVDADAVAYHQVVLARRMPRDGAQAVHLRATALRGATADATRVPLRTAERAADLLELAERLARAGSRSALSDVAVAGDLAWTALRGGLANVHANLPVLPEGDPLPAELRPRLDELGALAARGVDRIHEALRRRDRDHGGVATVAANEPTP